MSERPPIESEGIVLSERVPGRLYEVEMRNRHLAMAVLPKQGPLPRSGEDHAGSRVRVAFSPFDMSRCRILEWLEE